MYRRRCRSRSLSRCVQLSARGPGTPNCPFNSPQLLLGTVVREWYHEESDERLYGLVELSPARARPWSWFCHIVLLIAFYCKENLPSLPSNLLFEYCDVSNVPFHDKQYLADDHIYGNSRKSWLLHFARMPWKIANISFFLYRIENSRIHMSCASCCTFFNRYYNERCN